MDQFYACYREKSGNGLIVVPTAGGKSLVVGGLTTEIIKNWPKQRIAIATHVQELVRQNFEKIMLCWPQAPAGIYSAALGIRQAHHPIVVASVQSIYKKAKLLGWRDILFIDEAHLIQFGNAGMYGILIAALKAINPNLIVVGLTATDYRLDGGQLTEGEGALFNFIIAEIPITYLLDQGYLTPPIGKSSLVQADLEGVKITAGEYNIKQMAARFDQREFMNAALDSDMPYFEGRRSIALFCATVENAQHVADGMIARGIPCEVVHGDMNKLVLDRHGKWVSEREEIIERFKVGLLRSLASVGVITTGTDIPGIDCIVIFRAMQSPGLYQQIVGRGFRVVYAPGYNMDTAQGRIDAIRFGDKPNFLILDHGGNDRHGPITAISKPYKAAPGEKKKTEKKKARICEGCRTIWPLEATICGLCGLELVAERDPTTSLNIEAGDVDVMGTPFSRGEAPDWFIVDDVRYQRHVTGSGAEAVKVIYYCGILQFNEYLYVGSKRFYEFWKLRSSRTAPGDVEEALKWLETIRKPGRIQVLKRNKFYEVLRHEFNTIGETQSAVSA